MSAVAATIAESPRQRLLGIAWMVTSTLCFVAVTGIVRYLGSDLPAAQAAFIRYLFGCFIMAPAILALWRAPPSAGLTWAFALRGLAHTFGVALWFYAMARIPIAEVTAIGYLTPIIVTIGAALFLRERLRVRRILGVLVGFLGAFVILRPGFQELSLGQIAQLGAAPLFAVSYLMTKMFTGRADSQTIVTMLTIFATLFLLPLAMLDWQTPTLIECAWLFGTAIFATFGHFAMTKALAAAPIAVTQPVTFLQLVWASALGVVAFGEPIDPWVILGGTIIVGAASYIAWREAQTRGVPVTPPSNAAKL